MNKLRTGLNRVLKSTVLFAGMGIAAGANATTSPAGFPDFHFMGQTLSSTSIFSPEFDIFGLGDLGASATSYTALFDNVGGTALGTFAVFAVSSAFTPPTPADAVGIGAFFGSADSTFSFTSTPGKYYYAVVAGSSSGVPASYDLHVSAVPEAETWAMLLVGLGLVGSMIPRQRISSIGSV